MAYDIHLEQSTERPVAVVHRHGTLAELPQIIPPACGQVWKALKNGCVKGGRLLCIYWDDEISFDVGAELDAPFGGSGEVVDATLPGGRVATTTHMGPYQQLTVAHQAVRDWCAANGHTLAGANWEIYDHWQDAWNNDPSLIRTDVYYLLVDETGS